jgi:hypothetical protein
MSTTKRHILDFNKYAKEFLNKMRLAFPEEKKIQEYIIMFTCLEAVNPEEPVKVFMDSLKPYGMQIMKKDENYFKADQYVNKAESLSGKIGLISHWNSMSHDTKEAIWSYMQILYISGMGAIGQTHELQDLVKGLGV